ncbi:MAG: HlyD family secretion protein [Chloroflexota bacterium]
MKTTQALIVFLLLGILLAGCGQLAPTAAPTGTPIPTVLADPTIISEGRLEPIRFSEIALNASGLVSEVLVEEGDTVEAGQVIARLESPEARTLEDAQADATQQLTAAYQVVRDAQYKLDNFDVPNEFKDLTPNQAVESTLAKLNEARDAYEPFKYLVNQGREERRKLDEAWSKYRKAIQWMELQTAVDSAQFQLAQAQKDHDALFGSGEDTAGIRAALANAEVRAPYAGVITRLDLKVGEFASAGQPVLTLADLGTWVVKTTDLTEIDVVSLQAGQPVTVTLDALPELALKGHILSISQNYGQNQGDVVYEVTVLLTNGDPAMRWGMTAAVKFEK